MSSAVPSGHSRNANPAAPVVAMLRQLINEQARHAVPLSVIGIVHSVRPLGIRVGSQVFRRTSLRLLRSFELGSLRKGDEVLLVMTEGNIFVLVDRIKRTGEA